MNNVLTTLSKMLRVAKRLGVIKALPVEYFELLKATQPEIALYTSEEYTKLIEAADRVDPRSRIAALIGGDAGLRAGELMALEWPDVTRAHRLVSVQRQVWNGVVGTPRAARAAQSR